MVGFGPADGFYGVGGNAGIVGVCCDGSKARSVEGPSLVAFCIAVKDDRHLLSCQRGFWLKGRGSCAVDDAIVVGPADGVIVVLARRDVGEAGGVSLR